MTSIKKLNELHEYVKEKADWCRRRADELDLDPNTTPVNYIAFRRMEEVYIDMLLKIQAIIYWLETT